MSQAMLRAAGASWLRYEKKCSIVVCERGLDPWSRPDLLAINSTRRLIEIEIKVTMSDFRNDQKKQKFRMGSIRNISQFYYLVPMKLVDKVLAELQPGHGLLTVDPSVSQWMNFGMVRCKRSAEPNREAPKISIRQVSALVKHQTGTLCAALIDVAELTLLNQAKT